MLKKLWVLQLLLSNSSWKRSSSCRFRFDGLVKDTFCHNRLSLNYLKSFAWVHWWHAYSAASFPSGVSLRLIEVYAGLRVCVCVFVCVCGHPAGAQRPRPREKRHEKGKPRVFFRISRYIGSGATGSISGTPWRRSGTWIRSLKAKEINAFHS